MAEEMQPLNIVSDLDRIWSSGYERENVFSNYYDYYFSGEDVKIYIDGLFDQEDELDIATFAYSIQQQKQPLYGFWSYNYDAVMYGTRIITGEMSLYTRYPQRMTKLLQKASANRMKRENKKYNQKIISKVNENDDINLEKYWSMSQLDRITTEYESSVVDRANIFSAHAPFNFVIIYGAEETALSPMSLIGDSQYNESITNFDRMVVSDVNQRSIKTDNTTSPMKIVIQQVNLMSMSTGFVPGGQPVVENYQFMARDFYFTSTDVSFIKEMQANNLSGISNSDIDDPSTANNTSTSSGNTQGGGGSGNLRL